MAYLDDIIIPSKTVEEGLEKLNTVFCAIRKAGLTLNIKKCRFFCRELEYVGFRVSAEGIKPGKQKLEAVSHFPTPVDVKSFRSFIGLASYFRRFVRGFAMIACPVSNLMKKNEEFVWGEEQNTAFELIKQKLSEEPVLGLYNPSQETEVHTDASAVGLGSMICQQQLDGRWKPISYYSRKTSKEESKYDAVELEVLAIVVSLEKFRVYLLGVHFVVKTDCNSIKMLANKKDINSRIGRWFVRLAEFDFVVEHVRGRCNLVPDALSRYPVGEAEEVNLEGGHIILGININTDWVAAMQRQDEKILKIRERLEEGDDRTFKKFMMYKARVYKYTKNKWRLYVPGDLRYDLVREAHESTAHGGIDKTTEKLKANYYFPKMKDFVAKYVHRCINCLYYKASGGKKPGTVSMMVVHYDHVGPYPTSTNQNKYVGAKKSPNEILFRYQINSPKDSPLTVELRQLNEEVNKESDIDGKVAERLESNREKQRQYFNKKRRHASILEPGTLVLVRHFAPASGESKKLIPKNRGPYEVVKYLGNDRYLIQDIEGEQQSGRNFKGIMAVDRLKVVGNVGQHPVEPTDGGTMVGDSDE